MGTALLTDGKWAISSDSKTITNSIDRDPDPTLSSEEAKRLAQQFAPIFVFHGDEQYFPCNPLFPIEGEIESDSDPLELLGTAESRKEKYLALPLDKKARLAKVYYRVRRLDPGSKTGLVLDYWLYYVWNHYRARGGLFPVWFDRSHPNDLEHIHLIVESRRELESDHEEPTSESGIVVHAIYASAHEGTIPANRYCSSPQGLSGRPQILVELGSHASAPDIDRDGLFTPGVDGGSGYKMLWGIRDRGITWLKYSSSYADTRSGEDSIVFSPESAAQDENTSRRFTYQLVSVSELAEEFDQLGMSKAERAAIFEKRIHWLQWVTGRSNGDSGKLLIPPDPKTEGESVGLNGFSSTERGIILGGTSLADSPGLYLGGRYGFLHGTHYIPDFVFEFDGILTTNGKTYLATDFLLSYPLSVSAKVMGGVGLLTDSISFKNSQWDWVAGLEVRFGHIQCYGGVRSHGPVNGEVIDIRLAYFF